MSKKDNFTKDIKEPDRYKKKCNFCYNRSNENKGWLDGISLKSNKKYAEM